MSPDRRAFLAQAAALAAATRAAQAQTAAPSQSTPASPAARVPHPALIAALADAVLPESLGVAGRRAATASFSAWIAAYTPVSEEMHGYGDQEITYTAADPLPGWNAQLEGLDLLAHRKHSRSFAVLTVAARRELVQGALARVRGASLPSNPIAAPHVAVALLSHWAHSAGATDLAYGVVIGKDTCRPLAETSRKPLPLHEPRGGHE